jgi:Cu/Ag efflux protein CusF
MNNLKKYLSVIFLLSGVILTHIVSAQSTGAYTAGQVRKVDLEQGKVTIRHEEIKNLDMPPMTMIFNVKNKTLLNGLKSGDQVEFVASSEGGKLYVIELKKGE